MGRFLEVYYAPLPREFLRVVLDIPLPHETKFDEVNPFMCFSSLQLPRERIRAGAGVTTELLVQRLYATNLGLTPKISFGLEGDHVHFQLMPKYNFTRVVATGSLFTPNNTNTEFIKTDSDTFSETRHSLGFGIGVLFDLTDDTFQSIALNLYYNNIDIGNAVTKLKFANGTYHTQQSLGFGVQYYFGFSKKK